MGIPDAAVGAVVAAFLTALVTALGLVITKENKTSEFRQAWIDALRADIAIYASHIIVLMATVRIEGRAAPVWKDSKDDLFALNEAAIRIRLRQFPRKPLHIKLLSALDAIEAQFDKQSTLDEAQIDSLQKEFLLDAQQLLKAEWTRVKVGEWTFRWSRRAAATLMLLTAIFLVCRWLAATIDLSRWHF
jgi:hypothetical protein